MGYTLINKTKFIAKFLLVLWLLQIFQPLSVYALTSGPAQPEAQSFQPVGVSDMVDLFSGDFKYNIPLMDVDGYPINLNYQSGVGIDDEASWVGLGWNLNVGAINRQLRGIPDDLSGDELVTEQHTKKKVTVGGKLTAKVEFFGKNTAFRQGGGGLNGSLTFGIFSDNYTGIGAEIGANAGMSFSLTNDGQLTAGLGIGILSNTASGVDVTPNASLSISAFKEEKALVNAGFSSSLGYNSRSGLKTLSFGKSFMSYNTTSTISYNTEPIMPKLQVPYTTEYGSFSVDVGGTVFGVYGSAGGTGYKSVRYISNGGNFRNPEYGYLYAERGKNQRKALHDYIREKDNPIIPELPNLALPIATPDVFAYNSQAGSGQFRLYRGGTGAYFDNEVADHSEVRSIGGDIGFGAYAHGGVTVFNQSTSNVTKKWTNDNNYLKNGDFQDEATTDPARQHVFFRNAEDKNIEDTAMVSKIYASTPLSISTSNKTASSSFSTVNNFSSNVLPVDGKIEKDKREILSTSISYLTGLEASKAGLNKEIETFSFIDGQNFDPRYSETVRVSVDRDKGIYRPHHISEITVTNASGQRMVYGTPVYNKGQQEISFAVNNAGNNGTGKVDVPMNGNEINHDNQGLDNYYHKDSQPAYAYSYLISGILSPDYVDKTGDGISLDDNGTGIKFNYSKIDSYKWRTPFGNKKNGDSHVPEGSLNRALLADPDDDKGSIVYGEKEIYYVHSIESKTKVAYFITEDRLDGLGVTDWKGALDMGTRQKCLKEIRLYSKENLSKPIKVVKFEYTYDLCPNTPNSIANGGGKLTLKKIWTEYGNTHKGQYHPYVFTYNSKVNGAEIPYGTMMTDRWGNYKNQTNPGNLTNEEYPYATQDKAYADQVAGLWHINNIELPSGGNIEVKYEADDYAYVQNKRAAVMVPYSFPDGTILSNANAIQLNIDSVPPSGQDQTQWFKNTYLNGSDYIYTKSQINVSTANAPTSNNGVDFVSTYCKVTSVSVNSGVAKLSLEQIAEGGPATNPIRFAAWQKMKNEYPKFAYPGYQNRVGDNGNTGVAAAVSAVMNAAGNLKELRENFYQKAMRKGYCNTVEAGKSFARISLTSSAKLGGGARVKQVTIKDEWDVLTGTNAPKGIYGQRYEYTTTSGNGKKISSGVATYEPSIGNDENALKEPVPYVQKIKGTINNYFELEAPFGESLYPAPSVGYSKVTVKDLDASGALPPDQIPKTGYVVNEFYTARDFPVRVNILPLKKYNPKPQSSYSLIRTSSIEELVLSQGYCIELNDMHGKPKANRVFNNSGVDISSTEYNYQVEDQNAVEKRLDNKVSIVKQNGNITSGIIGRDIEFYTDFREQETNNSGLAVNLGVDVIPFIFAPIVIPHFPINSNNEYKLFRSACAVKVIQTNGLIKNVVKKENGSSISVENVAYDGVTGEALLTKTQNEFNKDYYSLNLPAYWAYRKMGGAYQNQGMVLKNVSLNSLYEINDAYWSLLTQGDELVNIASGEHYWVVDNRSLIVNSSPSHPEYLDLQLLEPTKLLIDRRGKVLKSITGTDDAKKFKVVHSGYRNLLSAGTESIVSVNNPIKNNKLNINGDLSQMKVLSASLTTYDDEWPVDALGQVTDRIENTSSTFNFRIVGYNSEHGRSGSRFYNPCDAEGNFFNAPCGNPDYYNFSNSYLNSRLINIGIWPDTSIPASLAEPLGFTSTFDAPVSKYYFIGFAGDDRIKITIDNNLLQPTVNSPETFEYWTIVPIYLAAGTHKIEVEGYNIPNAYNNWSGNPGSIGVEIYRDDIQNVLSASSANIPATIFSTSSLAYNYDIQSFRTINGVKTWHFTYETFYNPFIQGIKGNWRPNTQKVYQENRAYDNIFTLGKKGVNAANAGYIKTFSSYWNFGGFWNNMVENPSTTKWITSNIITQYDKYGQELENKDALNRYSAASFDFKGELPSAVASNARNREIYVNSFEDRGRHTIVPDTNVVKEFVSKPYGQPLYWSISNSVSHSGNYSLALSTDGIVLSTVKHNKEQKTMPYLTRNNNGEFNLLNNYGLLPRGFEPVQGNEYIFNVWVKDNQPTNKSVNISAYYQVPNYGYSYPVELNYKAVVEGWKLLEGRIKTQVSGYHKMDFLLKANYDGIYIDDIRIHPKDAHLKSYAYDSRNFKLMAELDENAFATFYEYDDEGSLVRVKKETERGIATIKENRSSYRKKNL